MTHLNIQQGLNIEVVSTNLIKKLYEAALSVPEPLEGEEDAAYMSGNLLVTKAYRALVEYLTDRFDDLHINVTDGYYIPFEDSAVLNVLLANNIGSDGIGVTEAEAANATFTSSTFLNNTDITSFNAFKYFTKANTNPPLGLFKGCTNLEEIDLSNTSTLSNLMFYEDSKLNNVVVGNVTKIPNRCFCSCSSITTFNIPESCSQIEHLAFRGCTNLQTVSGLSNISQIGEEVFATCNSLEIDLQDLQNVVTILSYGVGILLKASGNIYMPKLTSLGSNAFNRTGGILKILCLGKITAIPENCFFITAGQSNRVLTEVYLPYECTSIGKGAFAESNTLFTTIKQYNLSVDDPNWVAGENYGDITRITSFGNTCFKGCSSLQIPASALVNAISIGSNAFSGCISLSGALSLPNLTSLGNNAFLNCTGITSIDFTGSTFTSIPLNCFYRCTNLTSILSLGSVTEIRECAFENTNISSITIPNSVKKCSCTIVSSTIVPEIIFPEGVEEIMGGSFYTINNSLTYIEIPSTVTKMGVFFHRSLENSRDNLCTVVIKATTPPELNYYSNLASYTRGDKFAGIYVPDSSLTAYQNGADAWQHSSIQAKLKPISQLLTDNPTAWDKYNRTSTV